VKLIRYFLSAWHDWRARVWSRVMLDQALGYAPRNLVVPLQDLVDPAEMYLGHKQKALHYRNRNQGVRT